MITKNYAAGEYIVREGEESEHAYYIVSGTVEVVVNTPKGERFVANQHAGEFFGEMGAILEEPRMSSTRAKTDVTVELFDIRSFEDNVIGNTERRNAYMPNLFERIRLIASMLRQSIDAEVSSEVHAGELEADADEVLVEPAAELPSVRLRTLEPLGEASSCVDVKLRKLPYNIGRYSDSQVLVDNDYYVDDGKPYNVSRGHCCIEQRGNQVVVRDRFSARGTILNGVKLGKDGDSFIGALNPGENELILGSAKSGVKFIVELD
ncbi:cyclic nucleotide-binding domain-containing protein [Coraliomargarita akajimensis]|uniref:Putative transcriptional regulator, Crp/Fnr family n=1 Tax=Coraliomargarita akajimensis (strain DSM 45221 / IAM 15411 / JCM 23193 / KCTC 12865 / 04OKA010-24) TaxID=583355 RepID=D5EPS2_CORAD|nr:cyclic nucleotide-binding domain-containing protein [Coraliomargarita akajimensis]ADE55655.1 putative transcriptional regulator, Crp/Fnr family [Coraliomargarita akajimensis DSM 45221]